MIPLVVDLETAWRGGQNQALLLLRGLYERGHAAELVAVKGSSLCRRALKAGTHVHQVSRSARRLSAVAKILSVISSGRIDLVHANEAHAVTAAWLAGAHRKVPFVISRRVGYPLAKGRIAQGRYKSAACIIANSHWVAEQAIASGAPEDRVRVIYEGTTIPAAVTPEQRLAARVQWQIAEEDFVFGCASAFAPKKGHEHVIAAIAQVRKRFPNARLLLAGDGETRSEMNALVARLQLQPTVLFSGFVSNMREFYAAIDAFVFPSKFEALGTSLLDAMSYSLPCISTLNGGMRELIRDGETGLAALPSAESFAGAMIQLLDGAELRRHLGEMARRQIDERFSSEIMIDQTLAIYDELLQLRHA